MKEKNIICTLVILLCIFSFGTLKASKIIDVIDKEELQQNDIYLCDNYKKYEIDNENLGVCTMVEFKDFKVAQHTSNYNRLVSDTKNNWEYGVFTKTRYAIVDINYS